MAFNTPSSQHMTMMAEQDHKLYLHILILHPEIDSGAKKTAGGP